MHWIARSPSSKAAPAAPAAMPHEAPPSEPALLFGRRPRLAVLLAGPLVSTAESKGRWLVQLRWLALVGMTATIATARMLVPGLHVQPLAVVVGIILVTNLVWTALVQRIPEGEWVAAQIAVDCLLLGALLWFSGGTSNPFAVFITFQVVLAGALAERRVAAGIGVLSLVLVACLAGAPSLPLASAPLGQHAVGLVGHFASLSSVVLFLGFFVVVYAQRLNDLRDRSARNERLAMLGRMAGGLSHELNTPLGTILIGARDLTALTADRDDEAASLARVIAEEAERASDIIGLLRGHVRPDQRAETVDLARFVVEIAGRELDRLGFEGERIIASGESIRVPVLRTALRQIVRNLLANAVQATEEAEPDERRRRITVEVRIRGTQPEIAISDNGPGFSPAIVARLGEPFQTTKDADRGLGLGLYVSSMLAQQMGASLRAEDVKGGGARVILTLGQAMA